MYIPPKHSTQLLQTEEDSIAFGIFTTTTILPNTIITADVNAHSPLWYLPTQDYRGDLIEDILLNFNHITLNTNTATRLPPNQTQQPTSPDITTASADRLAGRPSTFSHPITYLYSPVSVYITRPKQLSFISLKQ